MSSWQLYAPTPLTYVMPSICSLKKIPEYTMLDKIRISAEVIEWNSATCKKNFFLVLGHQGTCNCCIKYLQRKHPHRLKSFPCWTVSEFSVFQSNFGRCWQELCIHSFLLSYKRPPFAFQGELMCSYPGEKSFAHSKTIKSQVTLRKFLASKL